MKITKLFVPVLSGLLLLLVSSCDKLPIEFNQNYTTEFNLEPVTGDEVVILQKVVYCNLDSLLKANNISDGTLETAVLKESYIRTKDNIKKLTGIKSVKIYFTPENGSDILIAEKESISEDSAQVNLTVKEVELKDYMSQTKYTITVKGNVDIKESMELVAKLTYKYSAKVSTNIK